MKFLPQVWFSSQSWNQIRLTMTTIQVTNSELEIENHFHWTYHCLIAQRFILLTSNQNSNNQ